MQNVKEFGAVGDGKTSDTVAIQRAIDAGGEVLFPPGTYKSGTLYLHSHTGLRFEPGAILISGGEEEQWNVPDFCPQNRTSEKEKNNGRHLIVAYQCEDVSIQGGTIDGCYSHWLDEINPENGFFKLKYRNGQMLFFCESTGIAITDVELYESPYWCCFLHGCEQVNIRGVRIKNHRMTPNSDGIDLDCCRYVTVSDCRIDAGDDAITLRANAQPLKKQRHCEYVTVSNCILSSPCQAVRIGVGGGVIRNCILSNLVIHDTRTGIQLVSRYNPKSVGVTIENIVCTDILMECRRPLAVLSDVHGPRDEEIKPIRGIVFRGIRAVADRSCFFEANRRGDITDLTLESVDVTCGGGDDIVDGKGLSYGEFGVKNSPAMFHLKHIEDCTFDRVRGRWSADASPLWKYGVWAEESEPIRMLDCRFDKENRM